MFPIIVFSFTTIAFPRKPAWIVACLLLVAAVGCGHSNRGVASGRVTLDGEPVEDGTISFLPLDARAGQPAWGQIKAGGYSIPVTIGPVVGASRVEICWMRKTGKMTPGPFGGPVEEIANIIPPRYSSNSELKAEIMPGQNHLNFELKSK